MELVVFLSSGLFLGWSLGANDAANVFGTAVGSRMVRFRVAATICSIFLILGATISGAGAANTLGRLGAVNALPGAFTVALAAALTTFWMTRLKIPVSTSQAIVGAIIGWNLYASSVTDTSSLSRIVVTWVACPLLSGLLAVLLFLVIRRLIARGKPHLLQLDSWTRYGLLAVGAFGSYSLGANNIANVMGVFLPDNPFTDVELLGLNITGAQQLFFLGGVSIAVGVFTYSQRVMHTVGHGITRISPVAALVVVLAHSITLFLFASERLEFLLASVGLPTIPLVPVSSSQAVIGAIIGLGLLQGGRGIRYNILGGISLGWIATPLMAGVVAYFLLFFVDNVFDQRVQRDLEYRIDQEVVDELERRHLHLESDKPWLDISFDNPLELRTELQQGTSLAGPEISLVLETARMESLRIDPSKVALEVDREWLSPEQFQALRGLEGRGFSRPWQFHQALADRDKAWRPRPAVPVNRIWNRDLEKKLAYLDRLFRATP